MIMVIMAMIIMIMVICDPFAQKYIDDLHDFSESKIIKMMMMMMMMILVDTWLRAVMQQTASAGPLGTGTRSTKTEEHGR